MYDEFQEAVYDDPDLTLEEVNRLFRGISEEYGYVYGEDEEESYFWVEIPHNFQSPMYYISYATSALSALDLWLRSLEDWDSAVDTYLELAAMGMRRPYRETVEAVGLRDIFRERTMRLLAEGIQDHLEVEGRASGGGDAGPLLLWAAGGGIVLICAVTALAAVLRRRRAAARARTSETPWEIP